MIDVKHTARSSGHCQTVDRVETMLFFRVTKLPSENRSWSHVLVIQIMSIVNGMTVTGLG